jgi:hypothetical protein
MAATTRAQSKNTASQPLSDYSTHNPKKKVKSRPSPKIVPRQQHGEAQRLHTKCAAIEIKQRFLFFHFRRFLLA